MGRPPRRVPAHRCDEGGCTGQGCRLIFVKRVGCRRHACQAQVLNKGWGFMIQSDQATDHGRPQWRMTLPVAPSRTFSTCPGFTVLAPASCGGELELLVETTATAVHCGRCRRRAAIARRRLLGPANRGPVALVTPASTIRRHTPTPTGVAHGPVRIRLRTRPTRRLPMLHPRHPHSDRRGDLVGGRLLAPEADSHISTALPAAAAVSDASSASAW
jgi:hypothetical protein